MSNFTSYEYFKRKMSLKFAYTIQISYETSVYWKAMLSMQNFFAECSNLSSTSSKLDIKSRGESYWRFKKRFKPLKYVFLGIVHRIKRELKPQSGNVHATGGYVPCLNVVETILWTLENSQLYNRNEWKYLSSLLAFILSRFFL